MQFVMEEFGRRLTKLRIEQGYTQERMAAVLNVDRTHISKLESGTRTCSVDLMVQFSVLFDVSLDYLILGRTDSVRKEMDDVIERLMTIRDML